MTKPNESSSCSLDIPLRHNKSKVVLPALVLATSVYYSLAFTGGIIIGYVLCKLFCHFFVHNGKIESIFLDYGKWRVHLHHWIIGAAVLLIFWAIDRFYLPAFFAGAICGIIIQDIYDYTDWYQVIVKNKSKEQVQEIM